MGARYIDGVFFNVFGVFSIAYLTSTLKISRTDALLGVMAAALVMIVTIPLFGWLSDRIGRTRVRLLGLADHRAVRLPGLLADDHQRRQHAGDLAGDRRALRHLLRQRLRPRGRRCSATCSMPRSATPASPSSTSSPASSPRASRPSSRRRCSNPAAASLADLRLRAVRGRGVGLVGGVDRARRRAALSRPQPTHSSSRAAAPCPRARAAVRRRSGTPWASCSGPAWSCRTRAARLRCSSRRRAARCRPGSPGRSANRGCRPRRRRAPRVLQQRLVDLARRDVLAAP